MQKGERARHTYEHWGVSQHCKSHFLAHILALHDRQITRSSARPRQLQACELWHTHTSGKPKRGTAGPQQGLPPPPAKDAWGKTRTRIGENVNIASHTSWHTSWRCTPAREHDLVRDHGSCRRANSGKHIPSRAVSRGGMSDMLTKRRSMRSRTLSSMGSDVLQKGCVLCGGRQARVLMVEFRVGAGGPVIMNTNRPQLAQQIFVCQNASKPSFDTLVVEFGQQMQTCCHKHQSAAIGPTKFRLP